MFRSDVSRYQLLLMICFVIAELIVWPLGDFPLNDDWSYAVSVRTWLDTGNFEPGDWPAMTLYSHVLFGKLFCSLFGFSHFVLRISTIFLALLTALLFYRILIGFRFQPISAFFLTLCMAFGPVQFSLSNTFMTDVPFLFYLVLAVFLLQRYFSSSNFYWLIFFVCAALIASLNRQHGIVLFVASFFVAGYLGILKRRNHSLLLLAITLLAFFLFWKFDEWMGRPGGPGTYVSFSDALRLNSDKGVWWYRFQVRLVNLIALSSVFFFPFFINGFWRLLRILPLMFTAIGLVVSATISFWYFKHLDLFHLAQGNILYNCGTGPQILYDYAILGQHKAHSQSEFFASTMRVLSMVGGAGMIAFVVFSCILIIRSRWDRSSNATNFLDHLKAFIVLVLIGYFLLTISSESFFDRYLLPVFALLLLLFREKDQFTASTRVPLMIYLSCIFLFSMFSTRDYFRWHEARMELVTRAEQKGVSRHQINAGFEHVAFYNSGHPWWDLWQKDFLDHMVTCGPVPKYEPTDTVIYQRLLPLKKDTLFMMEKKVY